MKQSILIVLGLAVALSAQAAVLTVTNTDDAGPGSLRWCIEEAEPGGEIQFDTTLDDNAFTVPSPLITPLPVAAVSDAAELGEDAPGLQHSIDGPLVLLWEIEDPCGGQRM